LLISLPTIAVGVLRHLFLGSLSFRHEVFSATQMARGTEKEAGFGNRGSSYPADSSRTSGAISA